VVVVVSAATVSDWLCLQEKKRLVFDSTVGKDDASLSKLTDEDMRFLFS